MKDEPLQMILHKIIRNYYEKLYAYKLDNLEEMNNFLEIYNQLRQNDEIKSEQITNKELN